MTTYLSTVDLANLSSISRQAIEKVLLKIASGQTSLWRGSELEVRIAHGRGGRSGIRYEVKVDSLPIELQERFKALSTVNKQALNPLLSDKAKVERNWWLNLLAPVLKHPERTSERSAAIQETLSYGHYDWRGNKIKLSRRTVYAKIAAYKQHGIHGLARQSRSDKGVKRVILTDIWDKAVPFDNATKHRIAENVKKQIQSCLASNSTFGTTRRLTVKFLKLATCNAGRELNYFPTDADLKRICKIPAAMIKAESKYRKVAQYRYDKKAFADSGPRETRKWYGMAPMEVVVCDVHHVNVLLRKEDGTTGTPKMIAWMDMGTRRVWVDLIFFEKRGGVRNMDAISSFSRMVQHKAYGVPKTLYADNGSEYNFADLVDDALKLNVRVHPLSEFIEGRNGQVIRARPYNAAAKPIEAWFGRFEQDYLKHMAGYIGDDRMNTPTRQLGKRPAPYSGTFEEFSDEFYSLLKAYHSNHETGGQYEGKTPNKILQEHVDNGWKATIMGKLDLHYTFSALETRKVINQSIRVAGRTWTCDELDACLDDTIHVRIPKWCAGFNALILEDSKGNQMGIARPQELSHPLDPRRAKHSARRISTRNKSIRQLAKQVPEIDVAAQIIEASNDRTPVTSNEPDTVINMNRSFIEGFALEASSDPIEFEKARERERAAKIDERNKGLDELFAKIKKANST